MGEVARRVKAARAVGRAGRIPLVEEVVSLDPGQSLPPSSRYAFVVDHEGGARSWVALDAKQLAEQLLPRLVEEVLEPAERETLLVTLQPVDGEDALSLGSSPVAIDDGGGPDAIADFCLMPNRWIELEEVGASWQSRGSPVFVASGEPLEFRPNDAQLWRVELRHRSGTLEAALAAQRWRGVLLGAGLLAVLLASFGFLWIAEQRARRLAERELAFVAGVSHELRTPLTVVRTAATNLARGVVRDEQSVAEYGALIQQESERVADLVERALRFRRRDEPLELQDVDLGLVFDQALARCAPWHDRRDFTVEIELAEEARRVRADPDALVVAVHNLLENAVKYGPDGQNVRIAACRSVAGDRTVIEIADQGPGVAAVDRPHVFEPFYRSKAVRTGGTPGSGLGLSVAREVARAHGGDIELAPSKNGSGATFRLSLPAAASGDAS